MNVHVSAEGKASLLECPQQVWTGEREYQTAIFAGQRMTLMNVSDSSAVIELRYLGFRSDPFDSVEFAVEAAPAFAKSVLSKMATLLMS